MRITASRKWTIGHRQVEQSVTIESPDDLSPIDAEARRAELALAVADALEAVSSPVPAGRAPRSTSKRGRR